MTVTKPLAAAMVSAFLLGGCGSDQSSSSAPTPGPVVTGKPIPAPAPRESIDQAVTRIGKTVSSGDCAAINRLTAVSRPYDACAGLKQVISMPVTASASYGDAGGVIAYGSGQALRNAVLIVDSDGLYHIPLVDPFNVRAPTATKPASGFDAAAREVVAAFRDGDCDAFKKVALARFGPGSTPDQTCTYLERSPFSQFLATYPDAKPKQLGGNDDYAFYGVTSPEAFYTMVLARETVSGVAPGAPALPEGAPAYGFVDVYQTNPTTTGSPAG